VKLGQSVERHHGKHVVLDVIVHVGAEKAEDRVHDYGARVQPVVVNILVHARMPREIEPLRERGNATNIAGKTLDFSRQTTITPPQIAS
jgi:hypothetical protein